MERLRYVCIPGSPFTGSTLLGTLLNEHPDCASIGAAVGLPRRPDLITYLCSCGARFRECEFWRDIAARTTSLGYPVNVFESGYWNTHLRLSRQPTLNALLARSLGSDRLNDARDAVVARWPGARAAILGHGVELMESGHGGAGEDRKVRVHRYVPRSPASQVSGDAPPARGEGHPPLPRPSRQFGGIMKHTGADAATAAKQWKHYNVEARRVRRYLPENAWLALRYEIRRPARGIRPDLGFPWRPPGGDPDRARTGKSHIIGNKMRLRAVERRFAKTGPGRLAWTRETSPYWRTSREPPAGSSAMTGPEPTGLL